MYTHTTMNTPQSKARTAFKYFTLTQPMLFTVPNDSQQGFELEYINNLMLLNFSSQTAFHEYFCENSCLSSWGTKLLLDYLEVFFLYLFCLFWDWKMTALHNWKSPYLPPYFRHLKQMQGYISQTCASTTAPSLSQTLSIRMCAKQTPCL